MNISSCDRKLSYTDPRFRMTPILSYLTMLGILISLFQMGMSMIQQKIAIQVHFFIQPSYNFTTRNSAFYNFNGIFSVIFLVLQVSIRTNLASFSLIYQVSLHCLKKKEYFVFILRYERGRIKNVFLFSKYVMTSFILVFEWSAKFFKISFHLLYIYSLCHTNRI